MGFGRDLIIWITSSCGGDKWAKLALCFGELKGSHRALLDVMRLNRGQRVQNEWYKMCENNSSYISSSMLMMNLMVNSAIIRTAFSIPYLNMSFLLHSFYTLV